MGSQYHPELSSSDDEAQEQCGTFQEVIAELVPAMSKLRKNDERSMCDMGKL
jgi:hypothetical protein